MFPKSQLLGQTLREVTPEEATRYAQRIGAEYVETSVKQNIGVDACFEAAVRLYRRKKQRAQQPQKRGFFARAFKRGK